MHGKLIFWLREASASKYPFLCRTCFWEEDWYLGIMAKETHWWKVVNWTLNLFLLKFNVIELFKVVKFNWQAKTWKNYKSIKTILKIHQIFNNIFSWFVWKWITMYRLNSPPNSNDFNKIKKNSIWNIYRLKKKKRPTKKIFSWKKGNWYYWQNCSTKGQKNVGQWLD